MKTIYISIGILSLLLISSNAQWGSQQSPNYKQNTGQANVMQQRPLNTGYQFQSVPGQNRVTGQTQKPRPLKQTELQQSEESDEESVETKSSEEGQFDRRGMGQDRRTGQFDQRRINQQGSTGQRNNHEQPIHREGDRRGIGQTNISQKEKGKGTGREPIGGGGIPTSSQQDQPRRSQGEGQFGISNEEGTGIGEQDTRGFGVPQQQPRQGQGGRQFGMTNREGTGVRNGGSGFGNSQEQPRQSQRPSELGSTNQRRFGQGQIGASESPITAQQPGQGKFGSTNGARGAIGRGQFDDSERPTNSMQQQPAQGQFGGSERPTNSVQQQPAQGQFGSTNGARNGMERGQFGGSQISSNPAQQQPAQSQFGSTNGARSGMERGQFGGSQIPTNSAQQSTQGQFDSTNGAREGMGREVTGGRGISSSEAGGQTRGFGSSNEVGRRTFGDSEIPTSSERGNIQPVQQGRGQTGQTVPQEIPTTPQATGRGFRTSTPPQPATNQNERPLQRVTPSPPEQVGQRQGALQPVQPSRGQVPQTLAPEQGDVVPSPGVGQTVTPRIPNTPNEETDRGGIFGGSRRNNIPSFMGGGNSPGQGPGTSMFDQPMNRRGMFGGFGRNPLGGSEQPGQSNGSDQFGPPDFDQNSMFGPRRGFGASRQRQTSREPEQLNRQRQADVNRTRQNDQNSRSRTSNEPMRRQSSPRQTRENPNLNRRREDQQREYNRNG